MFVFAVTIAFLDFNLIILYLFPIERSYLMTTAKT